MAEGRALLKKAYLIFVLCLIMPAGCGMNDELYMPDDLTGVQVSVSGAEVSVSGADSGSVGKERSVLFDEKEYEEKRLSAGLTPDRLEAVKQSSRGLYYFDHMDPSLADLYAEIYVILEGHGSDVLISAKDEEALGDAFVCVLNDHPEIYWTEGYSYSRYLKTGKTYYTLSGKYTYSPEECEYYDEKIRAATEKLLSGISSYSGEYGKTKGIYEKIIKNTVYDKDARDNQNIISVLIYGRSVCQGYAKSVQYLLGQMGVECTVVTGKIKDGTGHAWNLVKVDGEYYYLDATWGDEEYRSLNGEKAVPGRDISYDYLNVTFEDIKDTHVADPDIDLPECVATDANYYVEEGLFFRDYNEKELAKIFKKADAEGKDYAAFRCCDDECYELFKQTLIENKRIFDVLPEGSETVDYTTNDRARILCFMF
ncbi:MAG: hypothetical protein IKQ88_06135 [Lachnospiraceae bacterium]|nr:hypothetical protein [Lachnospiraceae bacterium]